MKKNRLDKAPTRAKSRRGASQNRALLATALMFASTLAMSDAPLDQKVRYTIAPGTPLEDALIQWGAQSGVQILINSATVTSVHTAGIEGTQPAAAALATLLKDSGLSYTWVGKTVHVVSVEDTRAAAPPKRIGSDDSGKKATAGTENPQGLARRSDIDEVVVSAEKRTERLQDVPVPVAAVSAATLTENSQTRLMDYYNQVPSLLISPADYSSQLIAVRGITTGSNSGAGTPTTGIMVDDVPFGNSTGNTPGFTVPDFDPGDLARMEVLRGPQGTLYGASSMGGLIKYVTVDPSTSGLSGRLEASTEAVHNGAQLGYTFRGSVNVPLNEQFAIRASAFTRLDPGYIDNPVLGIDGINKDRASGGRLAALWKPTDNFSLKLSAIYQQIKGDGTADVTNVENVTGQYNSLGDLQQGYIRGVGPYDRKAEVYGAIATYKIGKAEITSVTGYNVSDVNDTIDYTQNLADLTLAQFGVTGSPIVEHVKNSRVSQELRLATPLGRYFDLLVGGYYDHEAASPQKQSVLATDASTGAFAGTWLSLSFPTTYTEYALFADLTYHVTDRFDIQVGGRESRLRIGLSASESSGPFESVIVGAPSDGPFFTDPVAAHNHAFTYLFTPRFKFTDDLMLYARLASGYRPGGPNTAPGVPSEYNPDKTENYEVGFKGSFFDRKLSIDTSVYYIDWKNVQLNLVDPTTLFGYTGNGGRAKSQGVEFSVELRPITGLHISSWVAYDDAKLTDWPAGAQANFEAGTGPYAYSGARLPLSPRFSANLSVDQSIPITDALAAFVGGSLSYVGDRVGVFAFSPDRQYMPAYAKTDLRTGVDYEQWRANLYVTNAFDRRGLISGGLGTDLPYSFYFIQPRTVGLSLSRQF